MERQLKRAEDRITELDVSDPIILTSAVNVHTPIHTHTHTLRENLRKGLPPNNQHKQKLAQKTLRLVLAQTRTSVYDYSWLAATDNDIHGQFHCHGNGCKSGSSHL